MANNIAENEHENGKQTAGSFSTSEIHSVEQLGKKQKKAKKASKAFSFSMSIAGSGLVSFSFLMNSNIVFPKPEIKNVEIVSKVSSAAISFNLTNDSGGDCSFFILDESKKLIDEKQILSKGGDYTLEFVSLSPGTSYTFKGEGFVLLKGNITLVEKTFVTLTK